MVYVVCGADDCKSPYCKGDKMLRCPRCQSEIIFIEGVQDYACQSWMADWCGWYFEDSSPYYNRTELDAARKADQLRTVGALT